MTNPHTLTPMNNAFDTCSRGVGGGGEGRRREREGEKL